MAQEHYIHFSPCGSSGLEWRRNGQKCVKLIHQLLVPKPDVWLVYLLSGRANVCISCCTVYAVMSSNTWTWHVLVKVSTVMTVMYLLFIFLHFSITCPQRMDKVLSELTSQQQRIVFVCIRWPSGRGGLHCSGGGRRLPPGSASWASSRLPRWRPRPPDLTRTGWRSHLQPHWTKTQTHTNIRIQCQTNRIHVHLPFWNFSV